MMATVAVVKMMMMTMMMTGSSGADKDGDRSGS